MELIQQFIEAKTGDMKTCEDTYVYNEHFIGVIDGATNVSGKLISGQTPGQHAARLIKETILQLAGDETINAIIAHINRRYAKFYKEVGIVDQVKDKPYERPSASMVLYSQHHHKVWLIGDCQFFYSDTLYQNFKHIDHVFGEVRQIIMQGELLQGKTVESLLEDDIGFERIKPLIEKQYNFQNETPDCALSYAVINGFPIPSALIQTYSLPNDVTHISFASDGYPVIFDTLEKTEAHLQEILRRDPLCIHENRSTKGRLKDHVSNDDRTYVKVAL